MTTTAPILADERAVRRLRAADANARAERQELAGDIVRGAREQFKAMASRGYKAGRNTRLFGDRPATGGTFDSHLDSWQLDTLRRQSRGLYRDNAIARGMIERLVSLVVGPGFTLQATTPDRPWNDAVEDAFGGWADSEADYRGRADLSMLTSMAYRHALIDGDVGFLWTDGGQLQSIAGERLANPGNRGDTLTMVGGVEMDAGGRAQRYHIHDFNSQGSGIAYGTGRAIDAENFMLVSCPRMLDQTRGEPALAAVMDLIDQLDDLIEATIVANRVAAMFGVLFESAAPDQDLAAMAAAASSAGIETDDDEIGTKLALEPGMIKTVPPGFKATQIKPEHPSQQFEGIVRQLVRLMGMDLGLPLELAMLDTKESNFSAGRMIVDLAHRQIAQVQKSLIRSFNRPVYRNRIGTWIQQGVIAMPSQGAGDFWDRHRWQAPPRPHFDREKEAKADILEIDNGLKTRRQAAEERGWDFDDLVAQRTAEIEIETAIGLIRDGVKTQDQALNALAEPIKVEDKTGAGAAAVTAETVQDTGLNGAQIDALSQMLLSVTNGEQSPEVVKELIRSAFPAIPADRIETMVSEADKFEPTAEPEPTSAPGPFASKA
jgi:lambda family phage portal protein